MNYNKNSIHAPGNVLRVPYTRSLLSGTRKMANIEGRVPLRHTDHPDHHRYRTWTLELVRCVLCLWSWPKTLGAKELGERHCSRIPCVSWRNTGMTVDNKTLGGNKKILASAPSLKAGFQGGYLWTKAIVPQLRVSASPSQHSPPLLWLCFVRLYHCGWKKKSWLSPSLLKCSTMLHIPGLLWIQHSLKGSYVTRSYKRGAPFLQGGRFWGSSLDFPNLPNKIWGVHGVSKPFSPLKK